MSILVRVMGSCTVRSYVNEGMYCGVPCPGGVTDHCSVSPMFGGVGPGGGDLYSEVQCIVGNGHT